MLHIYGYGKNKNDACVVTHYVKVNAENKNTLRRNTFNLLKIYLLKIHCRTTTTIALVHEYFYSSLQNKIALLFLLLFQDGCSLVNGSPNHQQQQQQQQQLTLILLFGNHCRMGQSAQVKKDY